MFEIGYSSAIDQGLAQLHQLERVTQLALEISTVNMLYVIQLAPKLANISQQITRIDLLEVDFLHPACLECFATLPNLSIFTVINPAVIGNVSQWNNVLATSIGQLEDYVSQNNLDLVVIQTL